jgi:hypothetical protein
VITTISLKLGIPYFYRIDAIMLQMRILKGGREGPADGLNGGEDAVLQPELEVDGGVGRHRLRDMTTLGWISGDGGQWNGCGSLTAAERDNWPPSDLSAARVGIDGANAGRCERGQSSAPAVFSKVMTEARKWWGGELATGSGSVHGRWQSLPRRTVGAVYERQRRRRLQSEAPPRSLGGAQLGDEARQQHSLLGEDARWR